MNVRELRKLQQAYSEVYEQQGTLGNIIDAGAKVVKKPIENFANKKVGGIPGALGIPGAVAGQQVDKTAQQLKDKDFKGAFRTVTGGVRSLMQSTDLFDLVKGYLIDEGYTDTEESALVIMANMSEEWTQSIIEEQTDPLKTAAENAAKRSAAFGSKKFQDGLKLSPSNPNSPNFDPKTLKTPGV